MCDSESCCGNSSSVDVITAVEKSSLYTVFSHITLSSIAAGVKFGVASNGALCVPCAREYSTAAGASGGPGE